MVLITSIFSSGIGYASMTIVGLYNIYFTVIVAWICFYFVSSFVKVLPWETCDGYWNTPSCVGSKNASNSTDDFTTNSAPTTKDTSSVVEFWE